MARKKRDHNLRADDPIFCPLQISQGRKKYILLWGEILQREGEIKLHQFCSEKMEFCMGKNKEMDCAKKVLRSCFRMTAELRG